MTGAKILVVDDEPQIRRMMRATLTGSGHQVDEARTGEEALEKFRAFLPDLVLLDLNMPGMGGLETCRELRNGSDVLEQLVQEDGLLVVGAEYSLETGIVDFFDGEPEGG